MKLAAVVALITGLLACQVRADFVLRGNVVAVEDGDTLTIAVGGDRYTVRLAEIDAPEICHVHKDPSCRRPGQPGGDEAKQALQRLALKRDAVARCGPRDTRYSREVCVIGVDGMNVNEQLVREGWAWAYRQYVRHPSIIEAERLAKAARRGVWGLSPLAVAPWQWRADCWSVGLRPAYCS